MKRRGENRQLSLDGPYAVGRPVKIMCAESVEHAFFLFPGFLPPSLHDSFRELKRPSAALSLIQNQFRKFLSGIVTGHEGLVTL